MPETEPLTQRFEKSVEKLRGRINTIVDRQFGALPPRRLGFMDRYRRMSPEQRAAWLEQVGTDEALGKLRDG